VTGQHASNLEEQIPQQDIGIFGLVWPARVGLGAMPMIDGGGPLLDARAGDQHAMGVIEPDQPRSISRMQRERIA
jgi:hypothetical protein